MTKRQSNKENPVTLQTVREMALAFPGVEEATSGGKPVFRVRGKLMARMRKDGDSLLIKIDLFKREILINAEPQTFYITDFYSCHPIVYVRLASVQSDTLRDLIEQAWRITAPKRLVEAYDAERLTTDTPDLNG